MALDSDQLPAVAIGLGGGNQLAAIALAEPVVGIPPQSLAALWLDFEGGEYWAGGTEYASLALVPGYSFTRSGQQGAVDVDGSVDWFAADTPAINGAGFHAFGALTNGVVRSQEADHGDWNKPNVTVAANDAAAPDGTTTADKLTPAGGTANKGLRQPVAWDAGDNTASYFVKKGGHRYHTIYADGDVASYANFDVQAGTVTDFGNANGFLVDCGDYYRLVLVFLAASSPSNGLYFRIVDSLAAGWDEGSASTTPYHVWQMQHLVGNFPDGGPLIATAGATAGIGASALAVTLANGTYDATFTFDDDSTQNDPALVIADGVLNLPTDFAPTRNIIKRLVVEAA